MTAARGPESRGGQRLDAVQDSCEKALPRLARWGLARLARSKVPDPQARLASLLQQALDRVLDRVVAGAAPAGQLRSPGRIRKALVVEARRILEEAVEAEQRLQLDRVAAPPPRGATWNLPLPPAAAADLARQVTSTVDGLPTATDRLICRAVAAGTHTPESAARIVDRPRSRELAARALALLGDRLGQSTPAAANALVKALRDDPYHPGKPPSPRSPESSAPPSRAVTLTLLTDLDADSLASWTGTPAPRIRDELEAAGLTDGPWARAGDFLVDPRRLAREVEIADLVVYANALARPTTGEIPPTRWNLANRQAKTTIFWVTRLFERLRTAHSPAQAPAAESRRRRTDPASTERTRAADEAAGSALAHLRARVHRLR